MPAQAKSLQITENYRAGMIRLRRQGQREAKRIWNQVSPDNLDGTFNVGALEMTVATLQKEAARLSSAYLSSFIASELGEPQYPPALTVWDKTFGGNPLREGLRSAVITAKMKIKDGAEPRAATNASRAILVSDVGLFIDTAARESLRQGMEMDDRIVGYKRAIKGTCAACAGLASESMLAPGTPLDIHPGCVCIAEPSIANMPDRFPRESGAAVFASLSPEKQDEVLGPAAAEKVRNGEATLADFVQHEGGFIRQKPMEAVKAFREEQHPRDRGGRFTDSGLVGGDQETAQQRQARRTYGSLFNRIREALGIPTASAPRMVFVPAGQGYTTSGVDNWGDVVYIQVGPGATRQLASRDPKIRRVAEYAILHEFGRVFGPTAAYQAEGGNVGAGRANEFANRALNYLNGRISKRQFREWARRNMPQWGKDPATITVPAP